MKNTYAQECPYCQGTGNKHWRKPWKKGKICPRCMGSKIINVRYPINHDDNLADLPLGLYLSLNHGALLPKHFDALAKLGRKGIEGPIIGPLICTAGVFTSNIKIYFADYLRAARVYGMNEHTMIFLEDDAIPFDGVLYGEWEIVYYPEEKEESYEYKNSNGAQTTSF